MKNQRTYIQSGKRPIAIGLICLFLVLLTSCTHEPAPITTSSIQNLSELGTVEYTVSKVVKATDNKNILALFGSRKIIFTIKATIKAGFDLNKMQDDDIDCIPSLHSVSITLPEPQILSVHIRPEDIHIAYEEAHGLRHHFSPEERNALLAQGEADIRKQAAKLGIYDEAKQSGKDFLEQICKQCGYEQVSIKFKKANTDNQ